MSSDHSGAFFYFFFEVKGIFFLPSEAAASSGERENMTRARPLQNAWQRDRRAPLIPSSDPSLRIAPNPSQTADKKTQLGVGMK